MTDATLTDDALPRPAEPAPVEAHRPPRWGWLERLRLALSGRKLSPAEVREREAQARERERLERLETLLTLEASTYAAAIPRALEQLNICHRHTRGGTTVERVQRVELRRPYYANEQLIQLRIDTRPGRLPRGVGMQHLDNPDVKRNLSIAIGQKVEFKYHEKNGAWYIIERELGARGIPAHVDYSSMLLSRPASSSGLSLPLGIGVNRKGVWRDLSEMPHMLIGGTTNAGKSNAVNAILCTLLRFNSARKLRLVLVDLKGGVEFGPYRGVPHIWKVRGPEGAEQYGIVKDREELPAWFERIETEGNRRLAVLEERLEKTIGRHNANNARNPREYWPHIVVVVDEWADTKMAKNPTRILELMTNMASRFRAVGIHIILCTQVPDRTVVPLRLKGVLPARLALRCPSVHASIVIIGDGSAASLEHQGRAILDQDGRKIELQLPLITEDVVGETVRQAVAGRFDEVQLASHDVTHAEIFRWAVTENLGELDWRSLWGKFKVRGLSQDWAKAFCKEMEGEVVVVGSTTYEVKGSAGSRPRRLLPIEIEPEGDTGPEEVEAAPAEPELPPAPACAYCGTPLADGACEKCGAPEVAAVKAAVRAGLRVEPLNTNQIMRLLGWTSGTQRQRLLGYLAEMESGGEVGHGTGQRGAKVYHLSADVSAAPLPPIQAVIDRPDGGLETASAGQVEVAAFTGSD